MTATTIRLRGHTQLELLGLGAACTALGFAAVHWPWLVSGLVFGAVILLIVVIEPLALVALMLALGPADLSFMTGGFKGLFQSAGGLDMNGIRLIGVTGGFTMLCLLHRTVQREAFGRYGRWYVLFLLWATASLATSMSPNDGIRLLLKLAYPFLTFIVVAGMADRPQQLDRLLNVTLWAGIVIVAINPLFLLGVSDTTDAQGYRRIGGLGTYANPFSFYLLVILLISFARFVVRGQARCLVLCGVLAVWIYLTLTRITLLALFAGILAILLYAALAQRSYRAILGGLVFAVALGVPLVPPVLERTLGFVPTPVELYSVMRSPAQLYESINWQGREVLWPTVYQAFAGDRLTGLGIGSTPVILRQYFNETVGHLVHNEYLRMAADTGLIGVGLFFMAILYWLIAAWRAGWRASARTREYALPAIGLILGWACISITDNAFDYYPTFTQYIGFLCGGALAAARLDALQDQAGMEA